MGMFALIARLMKLSPEMSVNSDADLNNRHRNPNAKDRAICNRCIHFA